MVTSSHAQFTKYIRTPIALSYIIRAKIVNLYISWLDYIWSAQSMSFLYVVFQNIFFCVCWLINKNSIWNIFNLKVMTTYNFHCAMLSKEQLLSKSQKMVLSWNLIPTKDFVVQKDPKFCFAKIFLSSQTHSLKKVEVFVSSYRALKRFNLLTYNATVEIYIEFLINYLVILCT